MNDQADNFEALRKLLALKRYEQPPPGYFNQLSGRIICRLETVEPTFLEKLAQAFVLRPAMAYALGVAFCGAFAGSLVYSLQMRSVEAAQVRNPGERWDTANSATSLANYEGSGQPLTLHARGFNNFVTTEDEPIARPSIFRQLETLTQDKTATVNYSFPGQ